MKVLQVFHRQPVPLLTFIGIVAGLALRYGAAAPEIAGTVLLITLVVGGAPIVVGTLAGMLRGRFAADVVASLAIVGAVLTGEYLAGCVIVLMQSGGEALEAYGVRRASAALEGLLARALRLARRRQGDQFVELPVEQVATGDFLLVRPGDLVPVDAILIAGTSGLDESALTGEPLPRMVGPGDEVMSGAICLDGALELRALRPSRESQYERIVQLVRAAQTEKAPIGRLADRYAVYFTPLTIAVAVAAYLITGRTDAVLAVLVVATPCPLILATPVAVMAGINRAASRGVIVKSGAALEQIGQTRAVVFDKTGTLTTGAPVLEQIQQMNGYNPDEAIRLAAALEQLSSHPMARALVAAGRVRTPVLPLPEDVIEVPGRGVAGRVEGHLVEVGSAAFAIERRLNGPDALDAFRGRFLRSSGKT